MSAMIQFPAEEENKVVVQADPPKDPKQRRREIVEQVRRDASASTIQQQWRSKTPNSSFNINQTNYRSGSSKTPNVLTIISPHVDADILEDAANDEQKEQAASAHQSPVSMSPRKSPSKMHNRNELRDDAAQWPIPPVDEFVTVGPSKLRWPDMQSGDNDAIIDWIVTHKQVLTRCITWNMHAKPPPPVAAVRKILFPANRFHVYIVGTEECERSIAKSALNPSKRNWEAYLIHALGNLYVPLRSHTLQAIHLMVFVHVALLPYVSEIRSGAVATGVGNRLGNKGGVAVSFKLGHTRIVAINSHLAAHQHAVKQRNESLAKILADLPQVLYSPKLEFDEQGEELPVDPAITALASGAIEDIADRLIFMGDMNYRIKGNRSVVDKLLELNMHEVLLTNDQLRWSVQQHLIPPYLVGMCSEHIKCIIEVIEYPVLFRPTYKLSAGNNTYEDEKGRIPSWTDRILFSPKGLQCITYNADMDIKTSDHRPVYASFVIALELGKDAERHLHHAEFTSESQVCAIM